MLLELLRGHVRALASPSKDGAVDCQIGRHNIKVPKDLIANVGKGDDILFACTQSKESYQAWAIRNIATGKTAQIDPTNSVLIMLAGGFALILGLALGMDAEASLTRSLDMGMALIGMTGVATSLRRLFLITRAGSWVRGADI